MFHHWCEALWSQLGSWCVLQGHQEKFLRVNVFVCAGIYIREYFLFHYTHDMSKYSQVSMLINKWKWPANIFWPWPSLPQHGLHPCSKGLSPAWDRDSSCVQTAQGGSGLWSILTPRSCPGCVWENSGLPEPSGSFNIWSVCMYLYGHEPRFNSWYKHSLNKVV